MPMHSDTSSFDSAGVLGPAADLVPVDVLEEGVDVAACVCPVVHGVSMLVHVHDQERAAPGEAVRVIGSPICMDGVGAGGEVEDNPSRPPGERHAGEAKLLFPHVDAAVLCLA